MTPSPRSTPRETIAAIVVAIMVVAAISWAMSRRDGADSEDDSAPVSLDAPVAMDPEVRTGTLENGLRYYVRANSYPEERAELRLVVAAGSVHEDDDQRGLAHAVEHMAFRGTRRFPGRTIDEYLQSVGMRLGEDLNATTSFDETIYRLTIPTGRPAVIDTGLTILAEWAHAVTFDSAEARQEASVVFEEWRSRRDAEERLDEARDTLVLRGSRYASRAVIGDTASLRRFDVAAMRRFYRDWYRPELMAVVAVGDFDARAVEKSLRRRFDAIPRSTGARAGPVTNVPREPGARVAVLTDPEVTATRLAFWFPRVPSPRRTVRDYRRSLVERIGRSILRDRLEREAERAGSPLLSAGISLHQPVRPVESHVLGAVVADGRTAEGVATLGAAVVRLRRFGPKSSELEGVKESILRERRDALAGPPESAELADALAEHYLGGDPVPGPVAEYRWTNDLLSGIGAADVSAFLEHLTPEKAATILITTPSGRVADAIGGPALFAVLDSMAADIADEKREGFDATTLMGRLPAPGLVRSRRTLAGIDTHEWVLANGMRVLLKPTRFADDEVLLRVAAPGGASLAAPGDYPSAYMADNIIEATGAGEASGYDVSRLLDERSVSLSPMVSDERIQVSASGRQRDLELMLQLTHLYLTAPREDDAAFRRYQERLNAFARGRAAGPDGVFEDTVAAAIRPGDLRALPGSGAFVDAVDMRTAVRFWRERAANASNFTTVIVGDFEVWQVSPLIERYLASLPAGRAERAADVGFTRVAGRVERSVRRGVEPQAQTRILLGDTVDLTLEADAALNATRDLLDLVLQSRLREQLGGTYGVTVDVETRRAPKPSFTFTIDFSADPERVDLLAKAALEEIERLRTRGPTDAEASKVRQAAIEHNDDQARGNGYWASELVWHSLSGWSLESIGDHGDDAARISAGMLRAACARYLDGRRFVRVTRLPETGADVSSARPD